ncbi:hypothetical protein BRD00_07775 [Halobacteriales archaeon QS_8_69_26]|nr:MAG: hypothetical protein BRD00_07775 [Halobacteriales archaeon QS_8_69_26]
MTSLAEAYEGRVADEVGARRLSMGVGLFLTGATLTAVGVVVATTDLPSALGLDRMDAWRRAGVLAGLGVPAIVAGVFTVMPSSRRIKAAATIGASLSILGVATFWHAYPTHWAGYGKDLTLLVTSIYFFGTTASVWCLFVGIANFKRRNDPGGTVSLKVTKGGETRIVEVEREELREEGVGGVGLFGSPSTGHVETQTNAAGGADAPTDDATVMGNGAGSGTGDGSAGRGTTAPGNGTAARGTTPPGDGSPGGAGRGGATADRSGGAEAATRPRAGSGAASDGGLDDDEITSIGAEGQVVSSSESARNLADRYCGNCEHFRYVRSEDGMQPFCGFHREAMDDMEACDEWEPNH